MQHIEFFDKDHFQHRYHRIKPAPELSHFIDFFWQTKFDDLWEKYPEGFSDALFPNVGYTYLINLGTPFVMQVDNDRYRITKDSFLPRHKSIECHHAAGNVLFGIKFRISPVIFEKKINFSEYKKSMAPLSYLIDKKIIDEIKQDIDFAQRVRLLNNYFSAIVKKFEGSLKPITIVSEILNECSSRNEFSVSMEKLAARYSISTRTLQRYFEIATSMSSKQTLQILRVRKAVEHLASGSGDFDHKLYGYYDYSHFYKHLRQFLQKSLLINLHKKLVGLHKHPK
jgi:AraC-like DNA-binding protein